MITGIGSMTKKDMMAEYYTGQGKKNYEEAQNRIKREMMRGQKYVYLPGKNNPQMFDWAATPETIERLREDGFDIDKRWDPTDFWSVEWGYDDNN